MTELADRDLAGLYLALYFDEDISVDVVNNLRTRGFDVKCARDEAMLQQNDDEQLRYAVEQRRTIVTHNRVHFENQHQHWLETTEKHYGIIVAKRRAKDAEVVARLLQLLNTVTAEEMQNQLRYV
jgi:hypothetical protein